MLRSASRTSSREISDAIEHTRPEPPRVRHDQREQPQRRGRLEQPVQRQADPERRASTTIASGGQPVGPDVRPDAPAQPGQQRHRIAGSSVVVGCHE